MNARKRTGRFLRLATLVGLSQVCMLLGCGSNDGKASGNLPAATVGGSSATGGSLIAVGGTASASGGMVSSIGGVTSSGGSTIGSGGSSNGGTPTGGSNTGGSAEGGSMTGGNSSGGSAVGGSSKGGSATGGVTSSGGMPAGGTATAGMSNGGTSTGGAATGGGITVAPGVTKDGETQIALSGLTVVSYGGYLNGESFQQDGIVSFNGYQYAAFWNTNRNVVMARRALPNGAWEKFDFTDYTLAADDAHNTISLGICPGDGTLHLSFDHHGNNLHYRKSNAGFLTAPASAVWAASSFSAVTSSLVGTTTLTLVTYPRFVTEPGGNRMLFSARIGASGSGDEVLWEYDAATHAWISIGKYIDGTSNASATVNAYLHGLSYTTGGSRLHASWCWRDTPDASTNHDLFYIYSDDHGRTWKDNAGTTVATSGSSFVMRSSASANVWPIRTNRGLINQEHMAIDSTGRVHVLLGHMPDAQADDANFVSARTKSQYFHYWRNSSGAWTRTSIADLPVILNFRGKLAISSTNNVYAVLPDLRIAGAAASANFATWTLLTADAGRFFSDPLIDTARLETEDKLTIYYPQLASVNIWALDYTVN